MMSSLLRTLRFALPLTHAFRAVRTPLTRARRGALKDTLHEEILAVALKGILDRTGINPALVDDIQVGNVLPAGGGATVARMAALYAGYRT